MTQRPQLSDSMLVSAAREGDGMAFGALVVRHQSMLSSVCMRLLRDPVAVEDVVQEAILQGFLHLDRLRAPARFGPWLTGIGLNICRRWLHQRSSSFSSYEALVARWLPWEPADSSAAPDELIERADISARVRQAVMALPRGQRAAVRLYYLAGFTIGETAVHLGIAPNAVKARLYQARFKLAGHLQELWRSVESANGTHGGQRTTIEV